MKQFIDIEVGSSIMTINKQNIARMRQSNIANILEYQTGAMVEIIKLSDEEYKRVREILVMDDLESIIRLAGSVDKLRELLRARLK